MHGASDPFGFAPATPPHYLTDIHATVLHQPGLDPRRLAVPGRQRLERHFGRPLQEIIAGGPWRIFRPGDENRKWLRTLHRILS